MPPLKIPTAQTAIRLFSTTLMRRHAMRSTSASVCKLEGSGGTTTNLSNAGGSNGVAPIVAFDVSRLNFLGRGQTLSLQTKYSTLEQRESLNYIVPHFLGSFNRVLTLSVLYNTTQDVQTFSSRRAETSIQTSQRFNRASTLLLRFAYRRVSTGNVQIPSLLIPSLLQPVRIGLFSASYIQDHTR